MTEAIDLSGTGYMDYLVAAARQIDRDLSEVPNAAIEVDPDVAEFMGAFPEDALTEEEALEASLDEFPEDDMQLEF
ncbi:hypothetical protein [Pseudodesulfovibrio tunisiensis]|uniref:hypothetical protein n=1 Tax=Pseudodesulfovibrio tunisiensis TaxID=463192 RepID=UPI001FB4B3A3|nr:hypothetical protein [Pseudodesulfovibrio tunisiensis]